MKTNLSEVKTTILGVLCLIVAMLYFALPYFHATDLWDIKEYWLAALVIAGFLLLLAPDKFVNFLFSWMHKRTGIK